MKLKSKRLSLEEAVKKIKNGSTVGIGGSLLRRHPMALIHEIIRQRKKDLHLLGWNNGIDVDLLVGSGCTKIVESSYVGLAQYGLAPNFRRAVEKKEISVKEHSETTALDRFRAGSMGLTFFPSKTPLGTVMEKYDSDFKEIKCPHTGERYAALRAWNPDVSIIHAHRADEQGNIQFDEKRIMDNEPDLFIAKSSNFTIVTVEEIVSTEKISENYFLTLLPKLFIDAVVEVPFGAHPCSCDMRYDNDHNHLRLYADKAKTKEGFDAYLNEYVLGVNNHVEYLEKIGVKSILEFS
jgi:glutaconate CoA-transferase subunit A